MERTFEALGQILDRIKKKKSTYPKMVQLSARSTPNASHHSNPNAATVPMVPAAEFVRVFLQHRLLT